MLSLLAEIFLEILYEVQSVWLFFTHWNIVMAASGGLPCNIPTEINEYNRLRQHEVTNAGIRNRFNYNMIRLIMKLELVTVYKLTLQYPLRVNLHFQTVSESFPK